MKILRLASGCLTFAVIALLAASRAVIASADFAKSANEAASYLSQYIKIDTTNPPGNELAGAEFLAGILRKNGIEATLFDTARMRACVYARLKGNGRKRPVVLLNHIDVVPADAKDWKYPPFCGEIHDGEIWGRGALDMKGVGIAQLEAMLMLKRSGRIADRDVIFLATPDEEVGGDYGARWFVEKHKDLMKDVEYLFNEGFFIDTDNQGKPKYWGVDVSEKSVLWLKLTARGDAGHASMPMPDSATNRLTRALNKIINAAPEARVLPAVQQYFQAVSGCETGLLKSAYENVQAAVKNPEIFQLILQDKLKSSMLRNTVSLTVLKAGYKTNVIPAEASAELDCRLVPDVTQEDFIAEIRRLMNDPSIEVSVLDWVHTGASPYDTDCFKAIQEVAGSESPAAPVVPVVVPWFTDSHWFRDLGIIAYGLLPFRVDEKHLVTMHGKDERIPVDVFNGGVVTMYRILEKVCCP